jgi:hypothetical protein
VSNRGGVESGVKLTDRVKDSIAGATAGIDPQITPVKQESLDAADETGKTFTQMFTAMGSFGIFAGLLLLINLFVMLAAERKSELGMARAVGMKRSELVGAFATEGFVYALVATLLGTALGVVLGRVLVVFSQSAFSSEHNRFELYFTVKPGSLAQSFVVGFVVAVLTIVAMSIRVSRLNIIRAIRDIPEPPTRRRKRWLYAGLACAALGGLWTVTQRCRRKRSGCFSVRRSSSWDCAQYSRGSLRRVGASALAAATVALGALVFALFPESAEGASIMMYVAQGIVMTAGGVAFVDPAAGPPDSGVALASAARPRPAPRARVSTRASRADGPDGLDVRLGGVHPDIHHVDLVHDRQAVGHGDANVSGGANVFVRSSTANPVSVAALTRTPGVVHGGPALASRGELRSRELARGALLAVDGLRRQPRHDGAAEARGPRCVQDGPGGLVVGAERPEPDHRRPDVPAARRPAELQCQGR